ncbi:MAG: hypothetical protein ACMUJM_18940 [bacterium]
MKRCHILCMAIFFSTLSHNAWALLNIAGTMNKMTYTLSEDYANFYSFENSWKLAMGVSVAGVLANTTADREIQDWYQDSYKSKGTDSFSKAMNVFGNGMITIPVFLGFALLPELADNSQLGSASGEWGRNSLRAILVGTPPMFLMQRALGASRPNETDSHWRFFHDDNGVSGHSFMGAIPFLTSAHMTDNPFLKCALYLGSTLPGISRINDDKHYFSQAALGWWMAYLASSSEEGVKRDDVVIAPAVIQNSIGVMMIFHF